MAWFKREKRDDESGAASSPSPAAPEVSDLTAAEEAWIADHWAALAEVGVNDIDDLGRLYDRQLEAWSSLSVSERPDPNEMISRVGVGFGEFVRRQARLRWVIAVDQYGTDLALHGEPGNILLFPTTMVAKRWTNGEAGALPVLASATVRSVAEFRARAGG